MWQVVAPVDGFRVEQHSPVLDLQRVLRNAIGFEARLAIAAAAVELVVMPWADHVLAIECAIAQRAADVIADPGNRAELAVAIGKCDAKRSSLDFAQRPIAKLIDGTEIDPCGRLCSFAIQSSLRRNSLQSANA